MVEGEVNSVIDPILVVPSPQKVHGSCLGTGLAEAEGSCPHETNYSEADVEGVEVRPSCDCVVRVVTRLEGDRGYKALLTP